MSIWTDHKKRKHDGRRMALSLGGLHPPYKLESKPACRSRLIGRWHGGLGSPALGWPRYLAGQFEYLFRLSQENNVCKAFFLELFLERLVILLAILCEGFARIRGDEPGVAPVGPITMTS